MTNAPRSIRWLAGWSVSAPWRQALSEQHVRRKRETLLKTNHLAGTGPNIYVRNPVPSAQVGQSWPRLGMPPTQVTLYVTRSGRSGGEKPDEARKWLNWMAFEAPKKLANFVTVYRPMSEGTLRAGNMFLFQLVGLVSASEGWGGLSPSSPPTPGPCYSKVNERPVTIFRQSRRLFGCWLLKRGLLATA
jgi:hypothetical protein